MKELFVDASAFIAWLNLSDNNHTMAADFERASRDWQWITTNLVIGEVCTVLAVRINQSLAHEFASRIHSNESPVEIGYIDASMHTEAVEIFRQSSSKNLSFTDCTSFAFMRQRQIKDTFTFDRHFKQAGFTVLPAAPHPPAGV